MKYPQLVSTRAVNAISDWLESRLEHLGVDAPPVYSRLLLSLLHTPLQLHAIDIAELSDLKGAPQHQPHPISTRPLRNHRPDDHHFAAAIPLDQSESLKRQTAIESLANVVEDGQQTDQIEKLVDELCARLREIESQIDSDQPLFEAPTMDKATGAVPTPGTAKMSDKTKTACYFTAFPSLSKGGWNEAKSALEIKSSAESWPPANYRHQDFDETNNNDAVVENKNHHQMASSSLAGSHHSVDTAMPKRTRSRRRRGGKSKSNGHIGVSGLLSGSSGIGRKSVWDTNIEGPWEMGRDLIREFVRTQKMGLDSHELAPQRECGESARGQMQNLRARYERCEGAEHEDGQPKLYCSPPAHMMSPAPRRLYNRDLSSVSPHVEAVAPTPSEEEYATPTEEEYAAPTEEENEAHHMAVYEAKFGENIAALWSDVCEVRPVAQPVHNLSSFWSNYNRHRYMAEPNIESLTDARGGNVTAYYEAAPELPVQHESMFRLNFNDQNSPVVRAQQLATQCGRSTYDLNAAAPQTEHRSAGGEEDMSLYANPWSSGTVYKSNAELKEQKMREAFDKALNPNVQPSISVLSPLGSYQISRIYGNSALAFWSNSASMTTAARPFVHAQQQPLSQTDAITANTTAAAAAAWSTAIDSNQPPNTWPSTSYGPSTWSTQGTEPITCTSVAQGSQQAQREMASHLTVNNAQSQLFAPMNPHEAVSRYFAQPPMGSSHTDWTAINRADTSNTTASSASIITLHNHSQNSGFLKVTSTSSSSSNEARATANTAPTADRKPQVPRLVRTPIISCDESLMPSRSIDATAPAAAAPAEGIPELEHTHFRPIKFTYFDGHTFNIPSKLTKVDYRRSPGGSTWVDQDKYMRWIPCEDSDDETVSESDAAGLHADQRGARGGDGGGVGLAGVREEAEREEFVIKFCVKQQNEKGCQTVDDWDEVDSNVSNVRFGIAKAFTQSGSISSQINERIVRGGRTFRDASVFAASTGTAAVGGEGGVAAASGTLASSGLVNDGMGEWYRRLDTNVCCVHGNAAHTLWEHCYVCGHLPEVASMPADQAWLAELSVDGDEIMSDLRYMQRLYIGNDWNEDEDDEELDEAVGAQGGADEPPAKNESSSETCRAIAGEESAFGRTNAVSTVPSNEIYYNVSKIISDLLCPERARDFAEQAAQRRYPFEDGIGRQAGAQFTATSPVSVMAGTSDRYVGGLWHNADNCVWRHDGSPDGNKTDSVSSVWSTASTAPMALESGTGGSGWEHSNLVQIWNDNAVAIKASPVASMSTASAGSSLTHSLSGSSSRAEDSTDPLSSDTSKRSDRKRRHSAAEDLVEVDDTVAGRVRSFAARKHSSMYGDEPDLTTIITCNYWTTTSTNSAEDDFAGSVQALPEVNHNQIIEEMAGSSASVILRNMAIRSVRPLTR